MNIIVEEKVGGPVNQLIAVVGRADVTFRILKSRFDADASNVIHIQTKYYDARVKMMPFPSPNNFLTWRERQSPETFIGAIIANISDDGSAVLNELCAHRIVADDLKTQSSMILVDSRDRLSHTNRERLEEWSRMNDYEIVYLSNTDEDQKAAAECGEKIGLNRMEELLHIVDWPRKNLKCGRVTGKERLDRIINYLNDMPDDSDSDGDWMPTEEDKAAILSVFAYPHPSSTTSKKKNEDGQSGGNNGRSPGDNDQGDDKKHKGNKGKKGNKQQPNSGRRSNEIQEEEMTTTGTFTIRERPQEKASLAPIAKGEESEDDIGEVVKKVIMNKEKKKNTEDEEEMDEDDPTACVYGDLVAQLMAMSNGNKIASAGGTRRLPPSNISNAERYISDLFSKIGMDEGGGSSLMDQVRMIDEARAKGIPIDNDSD